MRGMFAIAAAVVGFSAIAPGPLIPADVRTPTGQPRSAHSH